MQSIADIERFCHLNYLGGLRQASEPMDADIDRRLVTLALAISIAMLATPAALILAPGVLFALHPGAREPVSLLVVSAAASLSVWMSAFWLLGAVGGNFEALGWTLRLLTVAGLWFLVYSRGSRCLPWTWSTSEGLWVLLVLSMALLRFEALWYSPVPAGADMSMHTYVAALIQNAGGVPDSYAPILPIDDFSIFPVGFQFLVALVSDHLGVGIHRAALLVSSASHALLLLSTYALVRRFCGPASSALAALAFNLLADDPAGFVIWGGNPTVLATALAVVLALLLLDIPREGYRAAVPGGLVLAGLITTHTIVLVQAFYLLLVAMPAYLTVSGGWRRCFLPLLSLGLVGCVLTAPYLLAIDMEMVTPATVDWIKDWVRDMPHSWQGSWQDALWTVPLYLAGRLDATLLLLTAGLGLLLLPRLRGPERDPIVVFALAMLLAGAALIINTRYWVLPLSYLIYPERVALMMLLPLALLFALSLDAGLGRLASHWRTTVVTGLLLLVVVQGVRNNHKDFAVKQGEYAAATDNDLAALDWIAENTPPDAVIETRYGDAGLWVPALAGRAVTRAHVNVVYLDKLREQNAPSYRFIGEKCVYPPCHLAPGGSVLVRFGEAAVYRLDVSQEHTTAGPAEPEMPLQDRKGR